MSAMQNATDRLRTVGNRIEGLAERLTSLGDKLYGATLEPASDTPATTTDSTYAVVLDNLEYAVKRCEMSLTRVEEQLYSYTVLPSA